MSDIMVEGHGPFSHMFDGKFIAAAQPGCKWKVLSTYWLIRVTKKLFT